jgi:hypothetical protein
MPVVEGGMKPLTIVECHDVLKHSRSGILACRAIASKAPIRNKGTIEGF